MLEPIHILSPQKDKTIDANGQEVQVDKSFIREIYDSYDPKVHEAPVVIGHDSDSLDEMPDWVPAYGWIKELKIDGDGSLYALTEVSDELAGWLENKFYKKVSAALYQKDSNINPKKGSHYLRHLAFLGASPPAIKGLEQFQFSESSKLLNINTQFTENNMKNYKKKTELTEEKDKEETPVEMTEGKQLEEEEVEEISDEKEPELTEDEKTVELGGGKKEAEVEFQEEEEETVPEEVETESDVPDTLNSPEEAEQFLNDNFDDLLATIISEGDKGYKGEITRFEPVPSVENLWLYDEDSESFKGRFIDESLGDPEIYDFTIVKEEDGSYTKQFSIVDEQEQVETSPKDEDETQLGEKYNLMEKDPEFMEQDIELGGYGSMEMGLQEENAKLKQMLAKMSAKMHKMKQIENEKYVANLFSEGRLVNSLGEESDFVTLLNSLSNELSPSIKFSEKAGDKVSQLSFVKDLLGKLPVQIQFGEMPMSSNDSKPIYEAPIGTMPSPEEQIIHEKTLSYIKEKGLGSDSKSYITAYKEVMKNQGEI